MTIREKITSLGLGPQQTVEVTLLLTQAFTIGAATVTGIYLPNVNSGVIADTMSQLALQILDKDHVEYPKPETAKGFANFSAVFGIDLTNEIP